MKNPAVFEFVRNFVLSSPEVKQVIFVLVSLVPVTPEMAERMNISNSTLVRVISNLRREGQKIVHDKELGYVMKEKVPYPMYIDVNGFDGRYYYGKLFGLFPCKVESDVQLNKGVNVIKGIIAGFDGERLIIKRVKQPVSS